MSQKSCISCGKQMVKTETVCSHCGALQDENIPVFVPQSEIKGKKVDRPPEDQRFRSVFEVLTGLYLHPASTIEPELFQSYRLSALIMLIIATLNSFVSFCFFQSILIDFRVDPIPTISGISLELIFHLILLGASVIQYPLQFFSWFLCALILWILLLAFIVPRHSSLNLKTALNIVGVASIPWTINSICRFSLFIILFVLEGPEQIIITSSEPFLALRQFFVQFQYILNSEFELLFSLIALVFVAWTSYLIYRSLQKLNLEVAEKKLKSIALIYGIIGCIVFLFFGLPIFRV
ncbi:MAG: hypothetical protein ACFFBD_23910 [Candidatus Hodarchaeota archaeon]